MTKGSCEDVGVMKRTTRTLSTTVRLDRAECPRKLIWLDRQRRESKGERLAAEEKARRLLTGDAR